MLFLIFLLRCTVNVLCCLKQNEVYLKVIDVAAAMSMDCDVFLQAICRHHVAMINSATRGGLAKELVFTPAVESTMLLMAMVRQMLSASFLAFHQFR